jgi:hypothetical protein
VFKLTENTFADIYGMSAASRDAFANGMEAMIDVAMLYVQDDTVASGDGLSVEAFRGYLGLRAAQVRRALFRKRQGS